MSTAVMNQPLVDVRDTTAATTARQPAVSRASWVELVIATAMAVAAGLLFWGAGFANNMVHDQLVAQQIRFPEAGSPGFTAEEFPTLQRYGGQLVDNGAKAKAYADEYIAVHLKGVADGKTYSQSSADSRTARAAADAAVAANDPKAKELTATAVKMEGQTQTLFRGETLRGLLLYAWGWWLVGRIAMWVAIAATVAALALFGLAFLGIAHTRRDRQLMAV